VHGALGSHLMASMRGDIRRGDSGLPACHRTEPPPAPSVASREPTEIWAGLLGSSSTDSGCDAAAAAAGGGAGRSRGPHRNGELGRATRAGALCSRAAMGDTGGDRAGNDALCCAFAAGMAAAAGWLG